MQIVRDPRTHKSKGFGFVSFLDSADFAKALREMQVRGGGGMLASDQTYNATEFRETIAYFPNYYRYTFSEHSCS